MIVNDLEFGDKDNPLWKEYDDLLVESLWTFDGRDNSGEHSGHYHGNFIPQIPNQLLRRFTRAGEWVLDPFVGSGTTFIEGVKLRRNVVGVDLNEKVLFEGFGRATKEKIALLGQAAEVGIQAFRDHPPHLMPFVGDSRFLEILNPNRWGNEEWAPKSVQHILYHPPYADIIKFNEKNPRDLSSLNGIDGFLQGWRQVLQNTLPLLDPGRQCALVMGDLYRKSEWVPLGFQCMQVALEEGLSLKATIVKNYDETKAKVNNRAIWRYRALKFGLYQFRHEYIFLFEKPLHWGKPRRKRKQG